MSQVQHHGHRRSSVLSVGQCFRIVGGIIVVVAATVGCASSGSDAGPQGVGDSETATAATDPLGETPDDLTIDITILPGADLARLANTGAEGARFEAHLVQSKYILFPDGSLHGDRGRSIDVLTRPARVRALNREAMSDLWLLLRQTGFESQATASSGQGTPDAASKSAAGPFRGNPALLTPSPSEVLTILTVRDRGTTTTFVNGSAPDATDPALTRVVRAVARLAWAVDDPPLEAIVQPIRYDFGPDPYAPYRGAAATR
jgi:hypothetical protein